MKLYGSQKKNYWNVEKCITSLLSKSSCTLKALQQLLGQLNFACTVIVSGRAFLQRLYALTVGIKKPYHFVRINFQVKQALIRWLHFMESYNRVTLYKTEILPEAVNFHTDAAKSLGYGTMFQTHWFSERWPSPWWSAQNITLLELVPIFLDLEAWGPTIRNSDLFIHTDNIALWSTTSPRRSHWVFFIGARVGT